MNVQLIMEGVQQMQFVRIMLEVLVALVKLDIQEMVSLVTVIIFYLFILNANK